MSIQSDDALRPLREAYPGWAFWWLNNRCGAIHRQSGVILDVPGDIPLDQLVATLDVVLGPGVGGSGCDEGADLRHGVDQPFVPQFADDLPRGAACDAELLDESNLRRDGGLRPVNTRGDTAPELVGDLHPDRRVGTELDHDQDRSGSG